MACKDEIIQKLTVELHALRLSSASPFIGEDGLNEIPRKRAEAIERNRIEYESRVETTYQPDFINCDDDDVGFDEVDSSVL